MVDYPTLGDEAAVVEQSLDVAPAVREVMQITELERFREVAARVFVDRRVIGYAVRLADATRHPEQHGLADLAPLIEYGASPRGPIGLAQSARALALLRGRDYATSRDVKDVAADVLRHRLVLSYEALADGVTADDVLDRVIAAVDPQDDDAAAPGAARPDAQGLMRLVAPPARQGPGPLPESAIRALDVAVGRRIAGRLPGEHRAVGVGQGTEIAQLRPYVIGDDVRQLDPAATARTGEPYVRQQVPERALTSWLLVDVSPSMAFGTQDRLKSDVAEGVARVVARSGLRRAGKVGLLTLGAPARAPPARPARRAAGDDRPAPRARGRRRAGRHHRGRRAGERPAPPGPARAPAGPGRRRVGLPRRRRLAAAAARARRPSRGRVRRGDRSARDRAARCGYRP